ncbi:MAG: DUF4143 domain-containing protein [Salinivirgaceae bacterium]|nr:DUF4143 domain-containing protein [Salinivirgaceae bacterium]
MANYLKRYAEAEIERALASSGAVLIAGPKFCGKTTTAMQFAKSAISLNTAATIGLAKMEPGNMLQGDVPRVIDEWQTVPDIWNEVRAKVDQVGKFGQFILTGSSTPADKTQIHHSGAGRITTVKMLPMSLSESQDSKKTVSLTELFTNQNAKVFDMNEGHQLSDSAFFVCRGGWPLSLNSNRKVALDVTKNYYKGLFNFEYSENEKFRNKKPEILQMVLRSYARNISTEASIQTIIADVTASNRRTMSANTFEDYMDALRDLFIIEDIEAWNPNLRSKTVVRTTPTRHFVDPSIACAALKISPAMLMRDLNSFGLLFEDMVVRDLKAYVSTLGGSVMHYRDSRGLECDAVVVLDDGRWALVEVKLGGDDLVNEGAAHLLKMQRDIAEGNGPEFMMVITATGPAYRRPDGVLVVPLNCLTA